MNDGTSDIAASIRDKAPLILVEIKKASSILLHCHPSPDPDSVGSALAMKLVLEKMGKSVTVIAGDSPIPDAFMHFPGAKDIIAKNYFEIDLAKFDLFIAQDSGGLSLISRKGPVIFPPNLYTIVIDHHATNSGYGKINLIEVSYPATAQVLADLFSVWGIALDEGVATNLFAGIYSDTGGLRYSSVTAHTYSVMADLAAHIHDISTLIRKMHSNTPGALRFQSIALKDIDVIGGKFALSIVPYSAISEYGFVEDEISAAMIASFMLSVPQWIASACGVEIEPGNFKISFRSSDEKLCDVSILAAALGGGGHKAASAARLSMSAEEAKKLVVAKAKELYNL